MKIHTSFARGLASLAVAGSLVAVSAPALSQPELGNGSAITENADRHQQMRERVQARLDDIGQRLQIDSRQQDAWNEYRGAVLSLFEAKPARPETDADAATVARHRADTASRHAEKLKQIADATAKLQEELRPEQQALLNEFVRQRARTPDERRMRHRDKERPRTP